MVEGWMPSDRKDRSSPNYLRPPITEAVIEFRFARPLDLEGIEKAKHIFSNRFPVITQLNQFEVQVMMGSENNPSVSGSLDGYRMDNRDSTNIVTITSNFIAYSRLAPYDGWDSFSGGALDTLDSLKRTIGFVLIARVGVRYINRLDIPLKEGDKIIPLDNYIKIQPKYPDSDFPPLQSFTMQTVFNLANVNCLATITVASVPSPVPLRMGIILDTDIGRILDVPQNPREMRELLNTIWAEKNRVFEASITDATRELFYK
jgi:uncharacterized protein (TIGR04255 family)